MLMFIFVFALVAGVIGFFMHARGPANGMGYGTRGAGTGGGYGFGGGSAGAGWWNGGRQSSGSSGSYGSPSGPSGPYGDQDDDGYGVPAAPMSAADAQAEARHWVELLGAGLTHLDGAGEKAAVQSLSEAAERHSSARRQLAEAQTAKQFELAGRTAREGLAYIRAARIALGQDPGPEVGPAVESVQGTREVTVQGQEYVASGRPGDRTPYYYPGGLVQGRMVPSGWYSTPWWKTALLVGGAGLGSMLIVDALFGGMHHGGMHEGMHGGGMFGGPFDGGGFGGGGFGGDLFGGPF